MSVKIGFGRADVAPSRPVHKFAPLGKGVITDKTADELVCKITVLQNDDCGLYYHISCPFGGVPREFYEQVKRELEKELGHDVCLTMAATHTHYAPNLEEEPDYAAETLRRIVSCAAEVQATDRGQLTCCYQRRYFDKVGQSRISGQPTKYLYLETFSIFAEGSRIATWIVYNSHPTTQRFTLNFFSGAGPAVLMRELEKAYPGEFFSYMIGAAGDVSTRFTRPGQEYEDMLTMCRAVEREVREQLDAESSSQRVPLDEWQYEKLIFHTERAPRDMTGITVGDLTPRELETLEIAKKKHAVLNLAILPKEISLYRLTLGGHRFIFTPFELFSGYMDCINLKTASLVNLANGAAGYLSCPGPQKLCFELLGETIPDSSKLRLMDTLRQWSK